jgi:hypothetical protein
MAGERNPSIMIATGQQGVGKSYRTEQELEDYIRAHGNRPVIIFDVNNEYTKYKSIEWDISLTKPVQKGKKPEPNERAIAATLVNYWTSCRSGKMKPEIRRIVPYKTNRDQMSTTEKVLTYTTLLKYAKNCAVLLEDMHTYTMRANSADTIGSLLNKRHRNQDIIIHTQSLDRIDPLLFSQAEVVRMHHQPSSIKRIAYKLPNPELFSIAKAIVDNEYGNKSYENHTRFFLYVYPQINKILIPSSLFKGCDKPEKLFEQGCEIYIKDNYSSAMKPYLDQVDIKSNTTKKIHTPQSAIKAFISDRKKYLKI